MAESRQGPLGARSDSRGGRTGPGGRWTNAPSRPGLLPAVQPCARKCGRNKAEGRACGPWAVADGLLMLRQRIRQMVVSAFTEFICFRAFPAGIHRKSGPDCFFCRANCLGRIGGNYGAFAATSPRMRLFSLHLKGGLRYPKGVFLGRRLAVGAAGVSGRFRALRSVAADGPAAAAGSLSDRQVGKTPVFSPGWWRVSSSSFGGRRWLPGRSGLLP